MAPSSSSSSQELVSCTMVALSTTGVESHTFTNLVVSASSITVCPHTGVQAIDAVILLYSVFCTALMEIDIVPPAIFALLISSLDHQVRLRTTRIPIFDERMGNPSFGIRGLGLLSTFMPPAVPPPLRISAIDLESDWALPEVTASKRLWQTLGVRLPFHFILILSEDHPLPSSPGMVFRFIWFLNKVHMHLQGFLHHR
jgi:hypothetical protein